MEKRYTITEGQKWALIFTIAFFFLTAGYFYYKASLLDAFGYSYRSAECSLAQKYSNPRFKQKIEFFIERMATLTDFTKAMGYPTYMIAAQYEDVLDGFQAGFMEQRLLRKQTEKYR